MTLPARTGDHSNHDLCQHPAGLLPGRRQYLLSLFCRPPDSISLRHFRRRLGHGNLTGFEPLGRKKGLARFLDNFLTGFAPPHVYHLAGHGRIDNLKQTNCFFAF